MELGELEDLYYEEELSQFGMKVAETICLSNNDWEVEMMSYNDILNHIQSRFFLTKGIPITESVIKEILQKTSKKSLWALEALFNLQKLFKHFPEGISLEEIFNMLKTETVNIRKND